MNIEKLFTKKTEEGLIITCVYSYELSPVPNFSFLEEIPKVAKNALHRNESSVLIICENDSLKIKDLNLSGTRDYYILPPSITMLASTLFVSEAVNKEIKEFVKDSILNEVDRKSTYVSLLDSIDSVSEKIKFESEISSDESRIAADMSIFLTAYCFPHFVKNYRHMKNVNFLIDDFYFAWLGYEDFMSQPTISRFSDMAFNSKRKVFRKAANLLGPIEIHTLNRLSKSISVDDLEYAVNSLNLRPEGFLDDIPEFNPDLLNRFSVKVRRNLIASLFTYYEYSDDTFRMLEDYATDYSFFKGVKTIEELHDRVIKLIPEVTENKEFQISDDGILKNSSFQIHDYNFKLLTNLKDFSNTGKVLGNCIGSISYYENSVRGKAYCYNIYNSESELCGALEIKKEISKNTNRLHWTVAQISTFKNKKFENDQELKDIIMRLVNEKILV